jgi:hypothetical protein
MFAGKRAVLVASCVVGAAAAASTVALAANTSQGGGGCTTVGAVGTSSATVAVPATRVASRYVVTATADNVSGQPYPQAISPSGPLLQLSNAMNPAPENSGPLGGVIDVWDSLNHVTTAEPKSSLTMTATDPGGVVRVAVWVCPS